MRKLLLLPFLFLALVSCSKHEITVKNQTPTSVVVASAPKVSSLEKTVTEEPIVLASTSNEALIQSLSATPNLQKLVANAINTDQKVKMGRVEKFRTVLKARKEIKKVVKEQKENNKNESNKSQLTALLLCIFLGWIGVHRFYLGYTWQGIVQLFTAGLGGIWTLIDLVRILTGDLGPKNGKYSDTL